MGDPNPACSLSLVKRLFLSLPLMLWPTVDTLTSDHVGPSRLPALPVRMGSFGRSATARGVGPTAQLQVLQRARPRVRLTSADCVGCENLVTPPGRTREPRHRDDRDRGL
jgi:hypothetical protein